MLADCAPDSQCTLDAAFDWARTAEAQGQPLVVRLSDGAFNLPNGLTFDSRTLSSEVRLVGHGGTVLQVAADGEHGRRQLSQSAAVIRVQLGAPPIVLEGLILQLRLVVDGGRVDVSQCLFRNVTTATDGGAISVTSGTLIVRSSRFEGNSALGNGGAVHVANGDVSLEACRFAGNTAGVQGGALHVSGGHVALRSGTLLEGNSARSGGRSLFVNDGGTLAYHLPAPLGRWIYGGSLTYEQLVGSVDSDYPLPCSAGLYGNGLGAPHQTGPQCSGPCPQGFYCPPATVEPLACSGGYCPAGAANPITCDLGAGLDHATVLDSFATSVDSCVCKPGYYDAGTTRRMQCLRCPVGTECPTGGLTLATLLVKPGYYRQSASTIDVRQCPDAAENCGGASECAESSSGCRGGNRSDVCRTGLTGAFCRLCSANATRGAAFHYVPAEGARVARCRRCEETLGTTLGYAAAILVGVLITLWTAHCMQRALVPPLWKGRLQQLHRALGLGTKLKILIGFYQIATKVGTVYEVQLPETVQRLLDRISLVITFGIEIGLEATPLECIGLAGHANKLLFWLLMPLVLALVLLGGCAMWIRLRGLAMPRQAVASSGAPLVLYMLFLVYPIVTREAFESFSCYKFQDGSSWLRADVSIECDTEAHAALIRVAVIAIVVYPCGLIVGFGVLLLCARRAITSHAPDDRLKAAITFLHREYKSEFFLWELAEVRTAGGTSD